MKMIPRARNRRHLVLACLAVAAVFVLARPLLFPSRPPNPVEPLGRTESPARPEPETSSPPEPEAPNMWAIPVPEEVAPPSAKPGEWKTMRHEGYMYSFQIPGDWTICTPSQMNRSRSRLVTPPKQKQVRVICAPFGIYDRALEADVPAMDAAFLLHDPGIHTVTAKLPAGSPPRSKRSPAQKANPARPDDPRGRARPFSGDVRRRTRVSPGAGQTAALGVFRAVPACGKTARIDKALRLKYISAGYSSARK